MKKFVCSSVLVLVLAISVPALAETSVIQSAQASVVAAQAQQAPMDVIKSFYAELMDSMKQGDKLGYAGRFKKLDPAVQAAFNLPLMARFSVGMVWSKATPEEQQQITSAFSNFSVATYASRFAKYDGEQFNVLGEKQTVSGRIVETTLKPKDSDAVALNYLMRQDEKGAWRIVDIFTAGAISELATRRAEFSSVIKRDGINALVNTLGEKSKQMDPT